MLPISELKRISRARFKDATVLYQSRRYDGAMYICGYAVEIALKARICKTLGWACYPSTKTEFKGYTKFRTHDFDRLIKLSGVEVKIKTKYLAEWSLVAKWNPGARYYPINSVGKKNVKLMIESAQIIMRKL